MRNVGSSSRTRTMVCKLPAAPRMGIASPRALPGDMMKLGWLLNALAAQTDAFVVSAGTQARKCRRYLHQKDLRIARAKPHGARLKIDRCSELPPSRPFGQPQRLSAAARFGLIATACSEHRRSLIEVAHDVSKRISREAARRHHPGQIRVPCRSVAPLRRLPAPDRSPICCLCAGRDTTRHAVGCRKLGVEIDGTVE